jgi:hypothetical protein
LRHGELLALQRERLGLPFELGARGVADLLESRDDPPHVLAVHRAYPPI